MKYLSLFSGIGGFEKGIQQAYEELYNLRPNELEDSERSKELHDAKNELKQWECVGYSEIDKYAIQVYEKHFNHKNYGDITKINEKELPDFDLLVGGFPCQSFSIAGKRGGFNDTRGTLFFEIARIVRKKQPRLLLLENVKGLLSHDQGRTFFTIISTLDELGYDCQWQVLNSKNFGVPQNRERVFIVGHLRGTSRPEVFPIGETNEKIVKCLNTKNKEGKQPPQQDRVYETDGVMTTLSAELSGRFNIKQLNQPKHSNDRVYSEEGLSPTLNTMQGGNRQQFIKQLNNPKYSQQRVYDPSGISPTIAAGNLGGGKAPSKFLKDSKIRRLTPKECERLQGFPDDWTAEGTDGKISDTQRYKMAGNAVSCPVVEAIVKRILV